MRPLVALGISQAMNLRTELEAARSSTAKVFGRARPPAAQLDFAAPCRCLVDAAGLSVSLTLALAYLTDLEATLAALASDDGPESHGRRRGELQLVALAAGAAGARVHDDYRVGLLPADKLRDLKCARCGETIGVASYFRGNRGPYCGQTCRALDNPEESEQTCTGCNVRGEMHCPGCGLWVCYNCARDHHTTDCRGGL